MILSAGSRLLCPEPRSFCSSFRRACFTESERRLLTSSRRHLIEPNEQGFEMNKRRIGRSDIQVTPVAMGCWPITGITSIDVTEDQSRATIEAAFDAGINFFDTAFSYGYEGQSEKMLGSVLKHHRDEIVIATKGGVHWDQPGQQGREASGATIKRESEQSLQRLGVDHVELYYLHAPDPTLPISEAAGAISELIAEGKVLTAGASNCSLEQLQQFHDVCPLSGYQPHYNMLQREIDNDQLPWCIDNDISVFVYWPLMKGLLAGKLARDHKFEAQDGRAKYPMFQGEEWKKNQDFIDVLRGIAANVGQSVAELVINWTIKRNGITSALCGAKRPEQIIENAHAMTWDLTDQQIAQIDQAIVDRGEIISRAAV
jgi:aryl-alcohol dehydrogenase-like predicted oxidoreductase